LFLVTANPRGWKWNWGSGLQALPRRMTEPITSGLISVVLLLFLPCGFSCSVASITVIVSWLEFATKTRRPSGEATMFQGSAPVRNDPRLPRSRATDALNLRGLALRIRITVTRPAAVLATYA
jgi:hypothetical protein